MNDSPFYKVGKFVLGILNVSKDETAHTAHRDLERARSDVGFMTLLTLLIVVPTVVCLVGALYEASQDRKVLRNIMGHSAGFVSCINTIHSEGGDSFTVIFDMDYKMPVHIDPRFPIPDKFKERDACGHFIVVWRKETTGTRPYIVWASKLKEGK